MDIGNWVLETADGERETIPKGTILHPGAWIEFDEPFKLKKNVNYTYEIRTGSYPKYIHNHTLKTSGEEITCIEFVDANGKRYNDWIPAIKLE